MSPSIQQFKPIVGAFSVILTAIVSVLLNVPDSIAFKTACSISRCEVTPTFLRYFLTSIFKVSSFILTSEVEPTKGNGFLLLDTTLTIWLHDARQELMQQLMSHQHCIRLSSILHNVQSYLMYLNLGSSGVPSNAP